MRCTANTPGSVLASLVMTSSYLRSPLGAEPPPPIFCFSDSRSNFFGCAETGGNQHMNVNANTMRTRMVHLLGARSCPNDANWVNNVVAENRRGCQKFRNARRVFTTHRT